MGSALRSSFPSGSEDRCRVRGGMLRTVLSRTRNASARARGLALPWVRRVFAEVRSVAQCSFPSEGLMFQGL
jgi:hypothetical protein